MIYPHDRVWMIGWEYPPHNSGGLGVACQGLTQSLSDMNTQIYFTLPFHANIVAPHLQIVECTDPSWEKQNLPPFAAYSASLLKRKIAGQIFDVDSLSALPQS